jgi:DNA-binding LacI/PurR family transcriptional regulator
VVGFDDIDLAAYAEPPLTTVAQDTSLLGRWGVERLVALMEPPGPARPDVPLEPVRVPTRLVERASTGRPPA